MIQFPTHNIVSPIVLLYGDSDSLIDIDATLGQLPDHATAKLVGDHNVTDTTPG